MPANVKSSTANGVPAFAFLSEAPKHPGRSPKVVLSRAQEVGVAVVKLQPPGKPLKEQQLKLAIHAAPKVFLDRVTRYAARRCSLYPGHQMHERAPLSVMHRDSRPQKNVVLLYSLAIEAAPIEHKTEIGESLERVVFRRSIPSPEGQAVYHVDIVGI